MNEDRISPPSHLPMNGSGVPRPSSTTEIMERLAQLIQEPRVPKVGVEASASMRACYETVARDIDRLAGDHVKRALELQQEAQTFSAMVRGAGERLCAQIEGEALRGFQISQIMTTSQKLMAETPESEG